MENKNTSGIVRQVAIVSRLKSDDNQILFDIEKMKAVLLEKFDIIKEYCYIIHDQDIYEEDGNGHQKGDLKPAHIHLLLKFEKNQPQRIKYIAKWFDIKENFVSRIKCTWKSACLYQIHYNNKEKHQYEMTDVKANFNYESYIKESRQKDAKKQKQIEIDIFIERILSGDIREYNKTLEIPHKLLVDYQRKFDSAFKVRSEYLQATQKDRQTECIYISGYSGTGKTTLAKQIADSKNLAYFVSSGSNDIMDGYGQEPCLIIDDIRPSCLGLSDLLKMLDPHVASSVKSRYKNKYLNAELVILTTVLDINTFYNNVFAEHDEPITQLKRRCSTYIRMDKESIYISKWDKKLMRYTEPIVYKNTVLDKYIPNNNMTAEDIQAQISSLIPFLQPEKDEIIDAGIFQLKKVPKTTI